MRVLLFLLVLVFTAPLTAGAFDCPPGQHGIYRHSSELGGDVPVCVRDHTGNGNFKLLGFLVVVFGGVALAARMYASAGTTTTLSGDIRSQAGASGLPERIFFALFGAPRDVEKEKQTLSWQERRAPSNVPPRGFGGRGSSRRW